MQRWKLTQISSIGVAVLAIAFVVASGPPAWAQVRAPGLSDAQQPGSVIVFPKFVRGFVAPDGVPTPKTEFEVGVVCPQGATCTEGQKVKIRFHYVCGTTQTTGLDGFVCEETDFDAFTTVNGKLVFNSEGAPPGNTITPIPECERGYLIGWVIDLSDRPIKFDGLIGNAILRESDTAVSSYTAIPIQANDALAVGAVLPGLLFAPGGPYQAIAGQIYGDVAYNTSRRATSLVLLTLDTRSNRPNYPVAVDFQFYNSGEALLSTSARFICWTEQPLTDINQNLTVAGMGSRKGVFITEQAEKFPVGGIADTAGFVTLLGLVQTLEGPTLTERQYLQGVFNNGIPVPTAFVP